MNTQKIVSIIIPTYNNRDYIRSAIESALRQSYKNFEIIVIDDGSTDDTKNILKSYIENDQINYFEQKNEGAAAAKNQAVSIARGKYIAFLDSDDEWTDKEKLKRQVQFLETNPDYVLVGTNGIVADEKRNKIIDYKVPVNDLQIRKNILIKNPFIQSSVLIRKNILEKAENFEIRPYINAEDYDVWLRVGSFGLFLNLKESMVMYMIKSESISMKSKHEILKNNIKLIRQYKGKYPHYRKAVIFAYIKYFAYGILSLAKNDKQRNKLYKFFFKIYRKFSL